MKSKEGAGGAWEGGRQREENDVGGNTKGSVVVKAEDEEREKEGVGYGEECKV